MVVLRTWDLAHVRKVWGAAAPLPDTPPYCGGSGRAALHLSFWGPLEAKSFNRAPKIDTPGSREGSSIAGVDLAIVTLAVTGRS